MYREAFINRLLYLLNLFAMSVFLLFFCYDLFLILFSWECIGLFSLLLVNFYSHRIYTIKATLKTFILSRFSDLFLFIFFVLTLFIYQTTDLSLIFIQTPFLLFHYLFIGSIAFHFLTVYTLTLVLSGVIKSAQFFAHVWLPDAMEAPTPASALIHSSTLVIAGVFLILRFSLIFEFTPYTNYFLAVLGSMTLGFGSLVALFQTDIKKLVAFSTISQIGYLVCGCGFLCYEEVLIYLIIHALNKAFLFIGVGYLVHFFLGNTDLRQMGSANFFSFGLSVLVFGVSLNLCGLPYSAGFIGKEFLVFQFFQDTNLSYFIRACWLLSFFCTPLYMGLLVIGSLFGSKKSYFLTYNDYFISARVNLSTSINFIYDQFTFLTGLVSLSILSLFWFLIFWGGEYFMLLTFNYVTLSNLIWSNLFITQSTYFNFDLTLYSYTLQLNFEWFLYFMIIISIYTLIYFKSNSLYSYTSYLYLIEIILILFLFLQWWVIAIFAVFILGLWNESELN